MPAENGAGKQRGRPFKPGRSGNPTGKAPGTRHRATTMAAKLMDDDAEAVVKAVLTAAKGGDMTACRIVLDRIAPPPRGRPVRFEVPPIAAAEDVATALHGILAAAGAGQITPDEAATVAGLIETLRRAIETVELETRIAAIEARQQ